MSTKNYDFSVEQGQDHTITLQFSNFDLTNYTIAEMHIRKTCGADTTELELSVLNGKITIDAITQKVIFKINEQDSFLITNNSVYDLFIEDPVGEDRKKIIFGKISVLCAVTRT